MKKLFLSVPMKGRTKEDIEKSFEKMSNAAKAILGEEVEVIHTWVEEKPPYDTNKQAIWYLGKSLELLSQADVFVCVNDAFIYSGCAIEHMTAERYELPIITLPTKFICPDIQKTIEVRNF